MNFIQIFMFFSFLNFTNCFITRSLIKNISPKKLRNQLHKDLKKKHEYISYQKVKSIFHEKISFIDIYGDNKENTNIEHIFPQYLFKHDEDKRFMKCDLHNLYLCNSKLNTFRQNFTYVDSEKSKHLFNSKTCVLDQKGKPIENIENMFEKQGYFMIFDKKKQIFLPTSYSRGKIARSLGYFAIRYNYLDQLEKIIDLETLLTWNFMDPVNNDEYLKNIICYKYQKNLNPFILDPDLLYYCFSDYLDLTDDILNKKKVSQIDPLYSIEYLINEIKDLEKDQTNSKRQLTCLKNKEIKKIKETKKTKKDKEK